MTTYKFAELSNERDATNLLIKVLEEKIKENSSHPIESFAISIENEKHLIENSLQEFEEKLKKYNYNPTNHEINKHIGMHITIKAMEAVKLMLPEIYIHCRNKQFASDYAKNLV